LPEEKKYHTYTIADIEKYHKGVLSAREMHELEKAALDDPFLADALEGYGAVTVNAISDLSELEKKLQERISGAKITSMAATPNSYKWWKVAAAVVVIGGLGFLTFRLSTTGNNKPVAELEKKRSSDHATTPIIDSNKSLNPGTIKETGVNKPEETKTTSSLRKKSQIKSSGLISADTIANSFATTVTSPASGINNQEQKQINDSARILNDGDATKSEAVLFRKSAEKNKTPLPQAPVQNRNAIANNYKKAEARPTGINEGFMMKESAVSGKTGITPVNYFRGRVIDENNNPLPFANIVNTRDNVGTYADAHGNFTLISPDSVLDVQVRSIGFENNLARLQNNVAANQVIMQDDKRLPDKIISFQKPDTNRSRTANMKLEEPEPADGWNNYGTYLANNINVSDDVKRRYGKGQVQVSFDVNQNGDPVNIKVERSLCQKCDEEAIRLIREGPKWKKKNKKARRVTISVPFDADR
jgi:CarboxypepD_reg-like domain/Gram-negative bacterial TonB protein C-terminal